MFFILIFFLVPQDQAGISLIFFCASYSALSIIPDILFAFVFYCTFFFFFAHKAACDPQNCVPSHHTSYSTYLPVKLDVRLSRPHQVIKHLQDSTRVVPARAEAERKTTTHARRIVLQLVHVELLHQLLYCTITYCPYMPYSYDMIANCMYKSKEQRLAAIIIGCFFIRDRRLFVWDFSFLVARVILREKPSTCDITRWTSRKSPINIDSNNQPTGSLYQQTM